MPGHVILKRLKVRAFPDGRLEANHREGALPPIDDGWWRDVLLDPRARIPTEETRFAEDSRFANYRLDKHPNAELMIDCPCGRNGVFNKAELIRQVGGDANVNWLARKLIDCGHRNKISNNCRAYCLR
jgi:hypothetical protein